MYDGKMENLTPAQQAAQDERTEEDKRNGRFIAAEHTNLPLNDFMTRLMAEEIPMLDSASAAWSTKFCANMKAPKSLRRKNSPPKSATSWICINTFPTLHVELLTGY